MNGGYIRQNHASGGGGAIFNTGSGSLYIHRATIYINSAPNGGAIYVNSGNVTLLNNDVSSNTASDSGGAVYVASGALTSTNTSYCCNIACALRWRDDLGFGSLTITQTNVFIDNSAAGGGGVSSRATLLYRGAPLNRIRQLAVAAFLYLAEGLPTFLPPRSTATSPKAAAACTPAAHLRFPTA